MSVGRTVIEGRKVVFELIDRESAPDPADPATAIDLMELDEAGQIASFTVFMRRPPPGGRPSQADHGEAG